MTIQVWTDIAQSVAIIALALVTMRQTTQIGRLSRGLHPPDPRDQRKFQESR